MTFIYISLFYKNSKLHTNDWLDLIFFRIIYVALPINFLLSIISKWLAKHISTIVSFKITTGNRHVYIDSGWPWIWHHCFFGNLKWWSTIMIVLHSFHLATRLNSQNTNETEFINELLNINLFMNIGISNWHNWNFDLT